jgi:2-keto-4-pentenoate hydratase/2-oxohepta-3-ene-1,7-dioic acid hydratase in catechol pathway
MKLYTFEIGGQRRLGAGRGDRLVDLDPALAAAGIAPDMLAVVQGGPAALAAAQEALADATAPSFALAEVRLLAPLANPGKILCSGINYLSHLEENPGAKLPEEPFFFSKFPSAIIGPGEAIRHPAMTQQLDYEVEFAVVIGKALSRASEEQVVDSLFGYTILHDVSARDVQFKDNQITLGKNFDTFAPLGPCIVTSDELTEPGNVRLRSWVNGEIRQDGSTRDWLFPLPQLLSFLSAVMTLLPGDIVSTGTPAGVGVFRKPPTFLQPGDVVTLEAEGIGQLENPVAAAA